MLKYHLSHAYLISICEQSNRNSTTSHTHTCTHSAALSRLYLEGNWAVFWVCWLNFIRNSSHAHSPSAFSQTVLTAPLATDWISIKTQAALIPPDICIKILPFCPCLLAMNSISVCLCTPKSWQNEFNSFKKMSEWYSWRYNAFCLIKSSICQCRKEVVTSMHL